MAGIKSRIGNVLAPWPFLLFGVLAIVGDVVAWPLLGWVRGTMAAFDVACLAFLIPCVPLFRHEPREMRELAQRNDANRGFLLLIASAVTGVILVSVGNELSQKDRPRPLDIALVIVTLSLCWLFGTLVYALHYAHLFYKHDPKGRDSGGLEFPGTEEPSYWDFAYFSSCLAMTFQTSDVNITSRKFRRIVIFHTLGAFVFNIGVIAFTINILGSK
ncbi:MAG TPA: DUF1345 domain-containing protein [Acidobacteriaceae bacterium]|jgi:uncharacterized membrane protein